MQRTFVTERPKVLEPNQVVVDLPRYEVPLTRAMIRRDLSANGRFVTDDESMNIVTTLNQIKVFVDELAQLDKEINDNVRIPYTNYVGIQFKTTGEAVAWARRFVARYFPETEERLLRKLLLNIPFEKTEIVWTGGDKYLPFVQRVAYSPSNEDLVAAVPTTPAPVTLTREEATKKRAEIAAKRGIKEPATQPAQ